MASSVTSCWRENDPKGHMAWHRSEVVRTVSKNRFGPYKVAEIIGPGHNPEAYQLKDGRYVCYVMGAYYLGKTLEGPWEKKKFEFDRRDRRIVEGLSNLSFAPREDGSYLMVCRGGGIWVSRDGLSAWEQVTQGSNYPKVKGRFEDPVLWKTKVQYHMIVNDWHGRIAYHLRSKNGVHWKADAGEAYMPGIALSEDGKKDEWYKYERIKVFLDEHGRAIQANFAVIDYSKWEDKANDVHSSKNISIPLTAGCLLTLLSKERITGDTKEIQVRIAAEPGFDPHRDIKLEALRFGAPEEVDFGRGSQLLKTLKDGKDLIAVFSGKGNGPAVKSQSQPAGVRRELRWEFDTRGQEDPVGRREDASEELPRGGAADRPPLPRRLTPRPTEIIVLSAARLGRSTIQRPNVEPLSLGGPICQQSQLAPAVVGP